MHGLTWTCLTARTATHPEILQDGLQIVGAFCFDQHWIPILLTPWGDNIRIASFDSTSDLAHGLAACLTRVAHALGFTEIHFDHIHRTFAVKSVCGAVAINFLRSQVTGFPRLGTTFSAWEEHHVLRRKFMQHIGQKAEVPRPWLWGAGSRDEGDGPPGVFHAEALHDSAVPVPLPVGFSGVCVDATHLCAMHGQQLSAIECPPVSDIHQMSNLRQQLIESRSRQRILQAQFGLWADDEIRFHLHAIAAVCQTLQHGQMISQVSVLDPLIASSWLVPNSLPSDQWASMYRDVHRDQKILISAVRIDGHWIPLVLFPAGNIISIQSSDFTDGLPAALINCLVSFAHAIGFDSLRFDHEVRPFSCRSACGAAAIKYVAYRLGLSGRVLSYAAVWQAHSELRSQFVRALSDEHLTSRPWVWASGDDEASETSWRSEDPAEDVSVLPESSAGGVSSNAPFVLPDGAACMASHVCIDANERIDLFATHGKALGDDEIRFHLQDLVQRRASMPASSDRHMPCVVAFEALNFLNWDNVGHILTEKWCQSCPQVRSHGHQIVAVVLEGTHWIPLWVVPAGLVLVFHTFDDILDYDIFDGKLRWMGLHLGFSDVVIHRVPHGLPSHDFCGVHALAFLEHILLGTALPTEVSTLDMMSTNLRAAFVQAMYEKQMCICPIVWGNGGTGSLTKLLAEELSLHGVPSDLAESRAAQAIKIVGNEPLAKAMQQNKPWRQLKALATNVGFKLVLPAELEATISHNRGKPVGKKSLKDKKVPGVPPPIDLDPSKLCVLDGTFRAALQPLPQLSPQQIGPISSGIVLMTAQEAEPYLRAGQIVSQEPLALVVFHRSDQVLQSMLPHSKVTVPCRCTVDNEPVLAEATLVQLGTGVVEKFAGSNLVALESPDVCTLRINVYKDETEEWDAFVKAPVKRLVSLFPELRRCTIQGCNCSSWHNEEGLPIKEPILDLWKRQFMKFGYKPAEASKADMFCVSIRVPVCLLERILNRSGVAGAYVEPRSADGQKVLQDYMVIWISRMSHRELMHMKQTNPAVVGLARIADRRGLRVSSDQAQEVHRVVRPDTLFLPQGARVTYIVGPFPFGIDRQGICKAMKQANWHCKPLQPAAPQPGRGAMWVVQAVDEPPSAIVHTSHGEILISKQKLGDGVDRNVGCKPIAAPATLALCGGQGGRDEDPWTQHDPWQKFQPSTGGASVSTAQTDSMQQMESRIQAAVLAKLPTGTSQSVPMEQDDVPDRICALECQVQQLMQKQTQMDGQFVEFTTQQNQQVSNLQVQLQTQTQQLHGQIESQNQSIQAMFENQLSHIRGLLSKRPRDECE